MSSLSPYLRYRLISEREVVAAVLEHHGRQAAEKFIQEVFWRTYFKGWLQARPDAWHRFLIDRDTTSGALDAGTGRTVADAEAGETGIEGFDDWAKELVATGYLHNHARMWFASIWIFTLQLPWTLGADFFLRHLVDADPACNTLSGAGSLASTRRAKPTLRPRAISLVTRRGGSSRKGWRGRQRR